MGPWGRCGRSGRRWADWPSHAHERDEVKQAMPSVSYPAALLHDAKATRFGPIVGLPFLVIVDGDGVVRARITADQAPRTAQRLADIALPLLH